MKAKVTFYVFQNASSEVSDVTTDPIDITPEEMRALQLLCSGASGFLDQINVNFGLVEPQVIFDLVVNGSPEMKEEYMVDFDYRKPISEAEFREEFAPDYAEMILERAADNLTGTLSEYYFASAPFVAENYKGDKVEKDVVLKSFLAVEFMDS